MTPMFWKAVVIVVASYVVLTSWMLFEAGCYAFFEQSAVGFTPQDGLILIASSLLALHLTFYLAISFYQRI